MVKSMIKFALELTGWLRLGLGLNGHTSNQLYILFTLLL